MGYATGQFGKNHLGDLNEFLPTVHGFDEFFGYLYHLDAMEDPFHRNYPPELKDTVGPRNMVHSWATDADDPTEQPRWGKVGKQKIEDAGPRSAPKPAWKTVTIDEILDHTFKFIDKAKTGRQAVLRLAEPDAHARRHPPLAEVREHAQLRERLVDCRRPAMAQLDDIVGAVMKKLKDNGLDDNTIVVFTTDNGAENFTWPDGGTDAVRRRQGRRSPKVASACPASSAGRAGCRPGKVENGIMSGSRLVPDLRGGRRQSRTSRRSC